MTSNDDNDNPWAKKDKEKKVTSKKPDNKKDTDQSAPDSVEDFVSQIREKLQKQTGNVFKMGGEEPIPFLKKKLKKGSNDGNDSGGNNFELPPFNKSNIIFGLFIGVLFWLLSGVYIVQEGDMSVVLRFGKLERTAGPGLSYRMPWPIELNIIKKVEVVNQINSSKNEQTGDEKTLVLTGDENMIHVNFSVFWKIKDIRQFLFTNRTPEETIKAASESSIREVLGQTTARHALTSQREEIGPHARELLQKTLDEYELGVEIINFQLQMVEPPSQVIEAFNDMQSSLIDANRLENEAQSYANSIIPRARGEAVGIIQSAKAYKETLIGKAKGEAAQFESVYNAAKLNKQVTLQRIYLEGIQKILGSIRNKTIVDGSVGGSILPHLSLDQKIKK